MDAKAVEVPSYMYFIGYRFGNGARKIQFLCMLVMKFHVMKCRVYVVYLNCTEPITHFISNIKRGNASVVQ